MLMFSRKLKGISMIEVIIVIVISTVLFFFASSLFATRVNTARDNAARQVMADIALVRNQAQQGEGPKTTVGLSILQPSGARSGNEIFGEAILFSNNSSSMTSYKLYQKGGEIVPYESNTINMPEGLRWYIMADNGCNTFLAAFPANNFLSCYINTSLATPSSKSLGSDPIYFNQTDPNSQTGTKLLLVFLNGSGQSYVFSAKTNTAGGLAPLSASSLSNYTSSRQGKLRLALWYPNSANDRYFATFDLSIPNNQTLEIK